MKQHLNANQEPQLFFYRDASKVEVDLLDFTDPNNRMLIEINPDKPIMTDSLGTSL